MNAPRASAGVAALLLAACVGLACGTARAAPGELPAGWKTTIVGVLPFDPAGTNVFDEPARVTVSPESATVWAHVVSAGLARDQVDALTPEVLRDRLRRAPDIKRTLALAGERYDLGMDRWKALQPKEALGHLDRALALDVEALAALADPKAQADVQFLRGVVLRELGDVQAARAAFVAALELDPGRKVARGYYDSDTEAVLAAAQADLGDRPSPLAARWPDDMLVAIAQRLGVDVLALGRLEVDGMLRLVLWDARTRAPVRSDALATGDATRARVALDRALSAWHACQVQAEQGLVRPAPRKTWFADVGYLHSVWLRHRRTRNFLHGPGAAIGVTWEASPGLELFVRTTQQATLSDANADLLDVFTTSRLSFGAGLAVGSRALRFSLRAALDVQIALADIDMTQDVDCKFFGRDHPRCGSIFSAARPTVWFGLDFGMQLRWAPISEFYFTFSAGNVSYVLAPSAASELNFPLYGSLGFGLPF